MTRIDQEIAEENDDGVDDWIYDDNNDYDYCIYLVYNKKLSIYWKIIRELYFFIL